MKETRMELIKKAAIYKVEICKQNGGSADYKTWFCFMSKQNNAELKRIIANIELHLKRKFVIA